MLMIVRLISVILITLITSTIIFSVDDTTSTISLEMDTIMKELNQTNEDSIGNIEKSPIKYDNIQGDLNHAFNIYLPLMNGDISIGSMKMILSMKAKATLSENRDYNMVLHKPLISTIVESQNHINTSPKYFNASKFYYCNYNYTEINYTKSSIRHNELNFIKKIERANNLTFILHMKNNLMILQNTSDFREVDKDNTILASVLDFWVMKELDINNIFLIILTLNWEIVIYNIDYGSSDGPKIKLITRMFSPYKNTIIQKISYWNNKFIFATAEFGLILGFHIGNSFNQLTILKEEVIDFVIKDNLFFCIGEEGLYIVDQSKPKFPYVLYKHKHMKQIDYVYNPFYGNMYIGIGIEQQNDLEEFFIELLVKPIEQKVILNKIFTGKKRTLLKYHTLDSFHSYFYDIISKELIIIRRAMLNSIPFLTYKLPIDINSVMHINSLYQSDIFTHRLIFITPKELITLSHIDFPIQTLQCLFKEKGTYLMRFKHNSDACLSSLNSAQEYSICQKVIDFKFDIVGKFDHSSVTIISVLSASALSIIIFVLSVTVFKKTSCFQKNTLKVKVKRSQKNRENNYEELNDIQSPMSNEDNNKKQRSVEIVNIPIQDDSKRNFNHFKIQDYNHADNQSINSNDGKNSHMISNNQLNDNSPNLHRTYDVPIKLNME